MKPNAEELSALATRIAESEARLQSLEKEIEEIGEPAAHELRRRLEALRVEENALKRNLTEMLAVEGGDSERMRKVEALMDYVQKEQASLSHEADFLHQSAPTSSEVAVRTTQRLVELCGKAIRRVIGHHHPLGESVFVNHNRKDLETLYDVEPTEEEKRRGSR